MNPKLWTACQRVGQHFVAPSGAVAPTDFRNADKRAFVKLVQEELLRYSTSVIVEEVS